MDQSWSDADEPRPRHSAIAWLTMLFLGWLVFELTADPALASLVACGKFGWNDWLTARWLQRSDTVRPRGLACACFYHASAAWKVAVAATAGFFLLLILEANAGKAPGREFKVVTGEALFGFAIAALLSTIACVVAWRSGFRVWVDSALHWSRYQDSWPPVAPWRRNRVPALLTSAIIAWLTPPTLLAMILTLAPINAEPPAPQGMDSWLIIALVTAEVVGIVGAGFVVLSLRELILRRVSAQSPYECWPEAFDVVS